jgi:hypothetical protein
MKPLNLLLTLPHKVAAAASVTGGEKAVRLDGAALAATKCPALHKPLPPGQRWWVCHPNGRHV